MELVGFNCHVSKRFETVINNIKNKSNSFYDSYLDLLEATIKYILDENNIKYDGTRTCGSIIKEVEVDDFLNNKLKLDQYTYDKIPDYIKKCNDHKHKKEKRLSIESVVNYLRVYFNIINHYHKLINKDIILFEENYFISIFGETERINNKYRDDVKRLKIELDELLKSNQVIEEDIVKYKSLLDLSELDKFNLEEQNKILNNQISILNEIKINIKVFEKLNIIEKQNSDIIEKLIEKKDEKKDDEAVKEFLLKSKKEYYWNSDKDFERSRKITIIFSALALFFGLLATIFVTITHGFYATYSLFDNIWMFLLAHIVVYNKRLTIRISDDELKNNSTYKYQLCGAGYWQSLEVEKIKYKVFRRLAYVSSLLNILVCYDKGSMFIVVLILELLFVLFSFISTICKNVVEDGYINWIILTGKRVNSDDLVSIYYCTLNNTYYSYEEFMKRVKI